MKRVRVGGLTREEFEDWVTKRMAAFRAQLAKLQAARAGDDVDVRRVRVAGYRVRSYRVPSHWRIVATVRTKK